MRAKPQFFPHGNISAHLDHFPFVQAIPVRPHAENVVSSWQVHHDFLPVAKVSYRLSIDGNPGEACQTVTGIGTGPAVSLDGDLPGARRGPQNTGINHPVSGDVHR